MNHLKAIALALALLLFAAAIIWALSSLAEEAAKSDDYFYVRSGWVSEPVLTFETERKGD